ncbi:hypothetical protein B484DRAFT_448165 [Ochromonadaceae sp. CCMP2298]|nr:hypothetical protein B484DRAFT_448165 [Ochromonadaceae sp. CCMP2298]
MLDELPNKRSCDLLLPTLLKAPVTPLLAPMTALGPTVTCGELAMSSSSAETRTTILSIASSQSGCLTYMSPNGCSCFSCIRPAATGPPTMTDSVACSSWLLCPRTMALARLRQRCRSNVSMPCKSRVAWRSGSSCSCTSEFSYPPAPKSIVLALPMPMRAETGVNSESDTLGVPYFRGVFESQSPEPAAPLNELRNLRSACTER